MCVVLQLSSGLAWRRGVGRLDMHHMCTESQLVLDPLAGWFRRSLLEGVK